MVDRFYLRNSHLVLGESAGLVAANDRHRTQCLDCWKLPDERLAFYHSLSTDCQRKSLNRWKSLGDDRNSDGDGDDQHFGPSFAFDEDAGECDNYGNEQGNERQSLTEPIQLLLEWCFLVLDVLD